eukprot:scaffold34717_cov34-Phaeocystis_antarctica.AAC.2
MPVSEAAPCSLIAAPTSAACHSLGKSVGTPEGLAQPSRVTISHATVLPATTSRPDRAVQSRVKLDTTEGTTRTVPVTFAYSRVCSDRTMTVTLCRPASQVAKSMNHSAGPPYQVDGDRSSPGGTSTKSETGSEPGVGLPSSARVVSVQLPRSNCETAGCLQTKVVRLG